MKLIKNKYCVYVIDCPLWQTNPPICWSPNSSKRKIKSQIRFFRRKAVRKWPPPRTLINHSKQNRILAHGYFFFFFFFLRNEVKDSVCYQGQLKPWNQSKIPRYFKCTNIMISRTLERDKFRIIQHSNLI